MVYHYFKSKEEIFTTLVKKASESSMDIIQQANQYQGTPLQKLQWMTERMIESIGSGEEVLLFLIMIQASTSDVVPEEVKEILKVSSPVEVTAPLIIAGQKEGEIVQADPIQLTVTYYALIQGLAINKIQWQECPMPDPMMIINIFRKRGEEK
ncbi:hypothetical protein CD798_08650 [Bacillaceae bacterium SAOS 7]|nr:hypothetical protein CD798_08650 [Bacillaceae bacterium SAOS 7]